MKQVFAWLWRLTHRQKAAGNVSDALPAAPLAPEWTRQNATDLVRFLSSESGQVFLARARAMEYNAAVQCVKDASAGKLQVPTFSDAINWLESLSRAGGDQPANFSAPTGETGSVERELAIA
jgi:hypothetical protein